MFKYIFGIAILILIVIAFFPTVTSWGIKVKEYFLAAFNEDKNGK